MSKRMKKVNSREEYRKKFNEQMNKFNYIMQDGEKSFSVRLYIRFTGLFLTKVICFLHMQVNSEY